MEQGDSIGPYTLYSGSSEISSVSGAKYGVSSGQYSDFFKDPAGLGDTCDGIITSGAKNSIKNENNENLDSGDGADSSINNNDEE